MTATKPSTTITRLSDHLRTLDERYRDHHDAIDAGMAAESICDFCGHVGLEYRGFRKPARATECSSYRAFVICSQCGNSEEF